MSTLIVPMVKISLIVSHPNADTLSIVKFDGLGWQSIIKTGQYQVGDWVVFVPPDAILPKWIIDDQQITYLKSNKGRVGAIKLRGERSEGVLLPLNIFDRNPEPVDSTPVMVGENAAERLGITKYDPGELPVRTGPKPRRDRPYNNRTFPVYTDIQHLKNFPEAIKVGEKVIIEEKIHGTNFRAGWALKQGMSIWDKIKKVFGHYDPLYFTCGSHRVEMGIDKPKTTWYDRVKSRGNYEFNLYQKWGNRIKKYVPYGYILYGEIFGDGVQDLKYGLTDGETDLVVFDVMRDGEYLNWMAASAVLVPKFNRAPLLFIGDYYPEIVERLTVGNSPLALANGALQMREGLVIRPIAERNDPVYGRCIYKSVSVDYLNRKGGTEFK